MAAYIHFERVRDALHGRVGIELAPETSGYSAVAQGNHWQLYAEYSRNFTHARFPAESKHRIWGPAKGLGPYKAHQTLAVNITCPKLWSSRPPYFDHLHISFHYTNIMAAATSRKSEKIEMEQVEQSVPRSEDDLEVQDRRTLHARVCKKV